jgi:transposase
MRRRWPSEEKRRIVQETLQPGVSVAQIAQRHALNANQLFTWRRLYYAGRLGPVTKLLPVAIADERLVEAVNVVGASAAPLVGRIEIKLIKGSLSLTGSVDLVVLRTALECLLG